MIRHCHSASFNLLSLLRTAERSFFGRASQDNEEAEEVVLEGAVEASGAGLHGGGQELLLLGEEIEVEGLLPDDC